jgi:hypothetical protein
MYYTIIWRNLTMTNFLTIIPCIFITLSISSGAHAQTLADTEARGYYQKLFSSPIPSNLVAKLTTIESSFAYSDENEMDVDAYILGETLDHTVVVLKSYKTEGDRST